MSFVRHPKTACVPGRSESLGGPVPGVRKVVPPDMEHPPTSHVRLPSGAFPADEFRRNQLALTVTRFLPFSYVFFRRKARRCSCAYSVLEPAVVALTLVT